MNWQERITAAPMVLVGKPILRGARIAVDFLVELGGESVFRLGRHASAGGFSCGRGSDRLTNFLQAALAASIPWQGHFSVVEEGRIRSIPLPE